MHPHLRPLVAAVLLALGTAATAAPSFVNGLALSGAALDLSGGTSVNNGRIGYFSDIYYDPNRNEWWGLSDRGPGGGTISYDTRVQRFTLDVNLNSGAISNFQIAETIVFKSGTATLNGLAPAGTTTPGLAFDPEGFVINPRTGTLLVSDEYGPSLREFSRSGQLIRDYTIPANTVPRRVETNPASVTPFYGVTDGTNNAGKRNNRGMEGLAISPDGKFAYGMLQSAMLDEGGSNGSVSRIIKYDTVTGQSVAQYAYQMKRSSQGQGTSALVAINDNEFMVIERNNLGIGVGANLTTGSLANNNLATADKEVYRINLSGATDVTGIDLDAAGAVYTKVTKSAAIIDLDANTLPELGNKPLEKWEGLAIGPRLTNGNYLLLAGTDNDYSVTQNDSGTQFDVYYRFSDTNPGATSIQCPLGLLTGCTGASTDVPVDGSYKLLPGVLQAYTITSDELGAYAAPVPEPGTWAMLLAGLAAIGGAAKRRRSR